MEVEKDQNNVATQKECPFCHEIKDLNADNFYRDKNISSGFSSGCKICKNKARKEVYKKNSEVSDDERKGRNSRAREYYYRPDKKAKSRLNSYKGHDKKKGLECTMTEEFLFDLLQKPCTYCGFPCSGADRLDNSLPHTNENCVPCCFECNMARSDKFTVEEMKIIGGAIRIVKLARILKT